MYNLAQATVESSVNLALIGIIATVVAGLFGILNYLLKRSDKTIEKNTDAGVAQAVATASLSEAVAKLNTSIVERDRQDREFHQEVMKEFKAITHNFKKMDVAAKDISNKADRNYKAITATTMHVDTMHVKTENVDTQINN